MEKGFKFQVIVIMVLIVGVIGLTIGFSAFSNSLFISADANVTPNRDTFNVDFATTNDGENGLEITPVVNPSNLGVKKATINNTGDPTVSGLEAAFTMPGQTVTYSFFAHNIGEYTAFLKNILYTNIEGKELSKECIPGTETSEQLVANACDDIVLKVKVGTENITNTSVSEITNHSLEKGAYEAIIVTIEYLAEGDRADGDFSVNFGNITLDYGSVDTTTQ